MRMYGIRLPSLIYGIVLTSMATRGVGLAA